MFLLQNPHFDGKIYEMLHQEVPSRPLPFPSSSPLAGEGEGGDRSMTASNSGIAAVFFRAAASERQHFCAREQTFADIPWKNSEKQRTLLLSPSMRCVGCSREISSTDRDRAKPEKRDHGEPATRCAYDWVARIIRAVSSPLAKAASTVPISVPA
jgi:hypothetical protein